MLKKARRTCLKLPRGQGTSCEVRRTGGYGPVTKWRGDRRPFGVHGVGALAHGGAEWAKGIHTRNLL